MPVRRSLPWQWRGLPIVRIYREALKSLGDRELAVFSLIAAGRGPGEIAKKTRRQS